MVTFEAKGGATVSFHNDGQSVLLNDGRRIRADELQIGDVFLIRTGEYSEVIGEVVVS